tara:strand:- start:258 stop:1172 length:915 start_codon:yes stop_codon:yes gene_type:complete
MVNNKILFWPSPKKIEHIKNINIFKSESDVEILLEKLFSGGYPVLLSSGRASITMAFRIMNAKRNSKTSTFPYANHCVLESISRYSIPVEESYSNPDYKIYYHQWGYSKQIKFKKILIEDSVDTMYQPGSNLFYSNGEFEIWSLKKILGTLNGGVLWCKSRSHAIEARKQRSIMQHKYIHYFIKLFSKKESYFDLSSSSIESHIGNIPSFALGEIYNSIKNWHIYSNERLEKYDYFREYLERKNLFFNGRLPNAIPVEVNLLPDDITSRFDYQKRIFDGIEVFPLPIHNQVPRKLLLDIKAILN